MAKIRILGAGWYGCSIAYGLKRMGHEVEIHELKDHIFGGASGGNPARLHLGFHYPRSQLTRDHCRDHNQRFLKRYGHLTRAVPINIYAVAEEKSVVDFGTYKNVLNGEVQFIEIQDPKEFGLANVEGAILTGERHIIISKVREFFEKELGDIIKYNVYSHEDDNKFDWTVDCTFCARDAKNVDRYEPCITVILEGPSEKAVTVMDGPFPSLYPWDEDQGLSSLTSAKYTPLYQCATWTEANKIIEEIPIQTLEDQASAMFSQMAYYWPEVKKLYSIHGWRLGIRAMPASAADSRLVDVVNVGYNRLRIRAGKIDAVIHAEEVIADRIEHGIQGMERA